MLVDAYSTLLALFRCCGVIPSSLLAGHGLLPLRLDVRSCDMTLAFISEDVTVTIWRIFRYLKVAGMWEFINGAGGDTSRVDFVSTRAG